MDSMAGGLSLYEDIEPDNNIDPSILDALESLTNKRSGEKGAPSELLADTYPGELHRNVGKFKREYAEALAMLPSWKQCQIEEIKTTRKGSSASVEQGTSSTTISYVRLERSDEVVFRATPGGQVSYIFRRAAGGCWTSIEKLLENLLSCQHYRDYHILYSLEPEYMDRCYGRPTLN